MSSNTVITSTTASPDVTNLRQRIFQNFQLIWTDAAIDLSNKDCQNTFTQLQNIVNDVRIFTQRDECIDFLTEVDDMKAFLIVEGTLGQQILPLIHDISQLAGVYILCSNVSSHDQWVKTWLKVKGIYTEVTPICESLRHVVKQNNQDSIAVSFITLDQGAFNQNLDQLEPTFMSLNYLRKFFWKWNIPNNPKIISSLTVETANMDRQRILPDSRTIIMLIQRYGGIRFHHSSIRC
jgi:hypothetical protein